MSAAMAFGFIGGALALSCLAGVPDDFSHAVRLRKTYWHAGDRITIDEVRGPSGRRTAGNTYEVTGTYTLRSRDKALLAAFVTTWEPHPELSPEVSPEQIMEVSRGEGRFTLRFHMWQDGAPHVSFYPPATGGDAFGGVYF